jgi:Fur family ferric uptake transcriptional regulator
VKRPLSAQELEKLTKINLATIYRNLKILIEDRVLVIVQLPGQSPRYEYNGLDDHHHFLCETCNRLFDVQESAVQASEIPDGFQLTKCDVTLHGVCVDCISNSSKDL